jgi:hypothetical protein
LSKRLGLTWRRATFVRNHLVQFGVIQQAKHAKTKEAQYQVLSGETVDRVKKTVMSVEAMEKALSGAVVDVKDVSLTQESGNPKKRLHEEDVIVSDTDMSQLPTQTMDLKSTLTDPMLDIPNSQQSLASFLYDVNEQDDLMPKKKKKKVSISEKHLVL